MSESYAERAERQARFAERGARVNARVQEVRQASQPAAPVLRVVETEPEIIDPLARRLSEYLRDESEPEIERVRVRQMVSLVMADRGRS